MSNNNDIILNYKGIKKPIKIPENYTQLENIFFKLFNEDKNKVFSFSYLSNIDKNTNFSEIKSKIINVDLLNNKNNNGKYENDLNKKNNNLNINIENDLNKLKKEYQKLKEKSKLLQEQIKEYEKKIDNLENGFLHLKVDYEKTLIEEKNIALLFLSFKSINGITYLIYSNKDNSMIYYDINNNQKINEIKNPHNSKITKISHCFDNLNKRDIIMSIGDENDIKLWDFRSFECIHIFKNIYEKIINKNIFIKKGTLSACFYKDCNQSYIITGCNQNYTSIKKFDFEGNQISETGLFYYFNHHHRHLGGAVFFINTFEFSSSIILGLYSEIIIYESPFSSISKKQTYKDNNKIDILYNNIILDEKNKRIIALCLDDFSKIIRIWNFYCGQVFIKININDVIQWNDPFLLENNFLFVKSDFELKIIDFKRALIINSYKGKERISSIKNILHPIYGKCIIILEENGKIKLLKITGTYDDIEENISPNFKKKDDDDDYDDSYMDLGMLF